MIDNIFLQLSALLAITVTIAFVMRLLRQPLMSAYIIAGIIAGPLFLNLIQGDRGTYESFSQFGVILVLFVVGLSLNLSHIKQIGRIAVTTGIIQVLLTSSIGFLLLRSLGLPIISALYLGVAITFSSTIIIVKLLGDKRDTESTYGRYLLGLMIVQDIIAITIMLVVTSLKNGGFEINLVESVLIKGVVLIALVYFLSKYLLKKILDHVAKSGEFLFIFTIAWCFGVAALLTWAGFSIEIGAIIAGLTLGSSPYQPEIQSRIKPLRDFFIILFFIILGSEISLEGAIYALKPGIILAVFVLIGNPLILYCLYRGQKFTRRTSFLSSITASQVSEFGFILLLTGVELGHLKGYEMPIFTVVALITIFISAYAITYNKQIFQFIQPFFRLFGQDRNKQTPDELKKYDVLIFGYHRIGWKVCEAMLEKKIRFAVVDFNPEAVSKLQHRGIDCFFGDAADVEFLESLPLGKCKLIVSTLPDPDDQLVLIKYIRAKFSRIKTVVNIYHNEYMDDLYEAGADYVMMPHLLGGNWIGEIIKNEPWTRKTFQKLRQEQREEMRLRFTMGAHE